MGQGETQNDKTDRRSKPPERRKSEQTISHKNQEMGRKNSQNAMDSSRSINNLGKESNIVTQKSEEDLAAQEEEAEKRKPWKKRKLFQDNDHSDGLAEKRIKFDESSKSPDSQE